MTRRSDRPPAGWSTVLDVIVRGAIEATEASSGCVLLVEGGELVVAASAGREGWEPAVREPAGYVVASAQPIALSPSGAGPAGAGAALGGATSVLCVPCPHGDAVVGALAVVDKADGASFAYEDLELATLLAGVAGAVLAVARGPA
ncbi:MAG TPA: GAF domain-containing protein [Acidimicrobiales bacterium]